ncbi:MAG: GtrA family protein [Bacillota bacterium]|uniref:Putative flippase GtrA (Transmembrane translocase of bactoprenol-linked glucose) n=1 Tax=[Clostridium] aminophilum TaxID=1526 RepID=A0A1I6J5W7_9FIRM|nr:GtrA family protein [[Clostridium] aminophilum]MDT3844114.1 GtrA family protein [Bacillota bacterium]SFR74321.1 Putative flippase GtrA (transmembrane translocase of bactoprenol-linked glucose) [[Clostridium] aminophilum]
MSTDGAKEALKKQGKELVNYLIVGILTTIVSLVIYYALTFTVLEPSNPLKLQAANILSWIGAVLFAYVTNKLFVFHSHGVNILSEFTAFVGARVGTLFLDMAIMFIGVTVMGYDDRIIKLLVQVVVTIANYLISKFFVFRHKAPEKAESGN